MKVLRNNNKTEKTKNTDTITSTGTPKQNSKNVKMASDGQVLLASSATNGQGGQQQNIEIFQVISFIKETMQKLKTFGEKFKVQLDSSQTQQDQYST